MKTILLADDYESIREFCRQELEDEGYRVITADDGAEAIDLVQQHSPDLVILDIHMPGKNGFKAAEQIKTSKPGIPVIFFTDHDRTRVADDHSLLARVCVEKCEDLTELKRQITRVLGSREANERFRTGSPPTA